MLQINDERGWPVSGGARATTRRTRLGSLLLQSRTSRRHPPRGTRRRTRSCYQTPSDVSRHTASDATTLSSSGRTGPQRARSTRKKGQRTRGRRCASAPSLRRLEPCCSPCPCGRARPAILTASLRLYRNTPPCCLCNVESGVKGPPPCCFRNVAGMLQHVFNDR